MRRNRRALKSYFLLTHDERFIRIFSAYLNGAMNSGIKMPYFSATVMLPIVAAVLLSIYFTYKNYKEIISVMRMLNIHTENADKQYLEKTYLGSTKDSVASLINENSKYKERIIDYNSARKVEIMDKLVRSAYEN